jgi:hypothetical protein
MANPTNRKKRVATASVATATVIASVSLGAAAPDKPITLSDHKLCNATVVSEFLDSLDGTYALPKKEASSLLALPMLQAWMNDKKTVYVCIQDGTTVHCCVLVLKRTRLHCTALSEKTVLPVGAIWLMVP